MSNFPHIIPAFTAHIAVEAPRPIGAVANGGHVSHVAIKPDVSTLKSVHGYPIQLEAKVVHGGDFVKADPDGKHVRLGVDSFWQTEEGDTLRFSYSGTADTTGPTGKVLRGEPGAKTTDFGELFMHGVVFETSSVKLTDMQHKTYVGSGRFVLSEGGIVVEYNIGEVTV